MNYATLASGIEAPSVAWPEWNPVFFSEIDPFCCKLLAHHYTNVPNLGDMTKIDGKQIKQPIDLIFAGTPCQAFSIAGLRGGLDDERGNLAFHAVRICAMFCPRWFIWENVPGVLSINGGRDFAAILGAFAGRSIKPPKSGWGNAGIIPGINAAYGLAYRILDAKYFGVPQQRRRIFLIGYLGDWRRAASVLFESESLRWHPRQGIKKGAETSCITRSGFGSSGSDFRDAAAGHLVGSLMHNKKAAGSATLQDAEAGHIFPCLDTRVHKLSDRQAQTDGFIVMSHGQTNAEVLSGLVPALTCNHEQPILCGDLQVMSSKTNQSPVGDVSGALTTQSQKVVFQPRVARNGRGTPSNIADALTTHQSHGDTSQHIAGIDGVRRITPVEAERLMGFPDNYTKISPKTKDAPRYKALGNSVVVPCLVWLKNRIELVEKTNFDSRIKQ